MKTFLCLVLVVFSFISYLGILPRLGIYMYHPIPHYIGMLVGIGLLIYLMTKKFTIRRLVATLFSVCVVGFFFWYTTVFTDIDKTRATSAVNEVASQSLKQIRLVNMDGKGLPLGELFEKNKGAIIVFTRGAW